MSEISAQIGSQIRTLRKKRKMTLDDLSGIIHKSRSTISKYEKGEIAIDRETLYEIADAIHGTAALLSPQTCGHILTKQQPCFF